MAIQGVLAIIRVSVWVWDPGFDNAEVRMTSGCCGFYGLTEVKMIALRAIAAFEPYNLLEIPKWALPAFQQSYWDRKGMFELAQKLRHDNSDWDTSFDILQSADCYWDLPSGVFMTWMDNYVRPNAPLTRERGSEFSCKVIKDNRGGFHFLPGWDGSIPIVARRADQGAIFTDHELESTNVPGKLSATSVVIAEAFVYVFGDPDISKRCIFVVDPNVSFCPGTIPFKQHFVVGWESPLLKDVLISLQAGTRGAQVNHDERFFEEPYEVKLMYSFYEPALTNCDDVERTSDSKWANLDPIVNNFSPYYCDLFHSFDDVRRTNNSMWEDLTRLSSTIRMYMSGGLYLLPQPTHNLPLPQPQTAQKSCLHAGMVGTWNSKRSGNDPPPPMKEIKETPQKLNLSADSLPMILLERISRAV